jgi:tRNA threonylcarbamoyl adenosine modification protein YjeE
LPKLTRHTRSESETRALAARLATLVGPGDVIALDGELGAGKTAFARGLVDALPGGPAAHVASPTFTLLNRYDTQPPVFHFDFYRLAGLDDLETTGYWDVVASREGVALVEWSQRIPEAFDEAAWVVAIEITGDETRTVTVTGPSDKLQILGDAT